MWLTISKRYQRLFSSERSQLTHSKQQLGRSKALLEKIPFSSDSHLNMKILVFTSLYPNNVWPHHGVFVKERMTQFARLPGCQIKVVAPVPYFPPVKISSRWLFSQVARQETIEGMEVHHPRYFMTPKIGMACYGMMMFLSVLPAVRRI